MNAYLKLRGRRRKFVDAYIEHGENASQAVREAGFKGKSANQRGYELLHEPEVQAAILERRAQAIADAGVTHLRTLREVANVAFFDIRELFNDDGSLKPPKDWPDNAAAAIAGIDVEDLFELHGEERVKIGQLRKFKVWSKPDALRMLMQNQKLLVNQHELAGPGGTPLPAPTLGITFDDGAPGEPVPAAEAAGPVLPP